MGEQRPAVAMVAMLLQRLSRLMRQTEHLRFPIDSHRMRCCMRVSALLHHECRELPAVSQPPNCKGAWTHSPVHHGALGCNHGLHGGGDGGAQKDAGHQQCTRQICNARR